MTMFQLNNMNQKFKEYANKLEIKNIRRKFNSYYKIKIPSQICGIFILMASGLLNR